MPNPLQSKPFDDPKPITLHVYRHGSTDFTLGGISSKVDTLTAFTMMAQAQLYIDSLPESRKAEAEAVVILDKIGDTVRAFPVLPYLAGKWQAFGGNIAVITTGCNFGESRHHSRVVINIMDHVPTDANY